MPSPTMVIDDAALLRVIEQGKRLGMIATARIERTVDIVGLKLQARAQEKTPIDTGTLRRSATTETSVRASGLVTTITFGGMASAYAEVQHENEEFTHTRAEFEAKYGAVAGKLQGHKGGQAHYLWGAENSAYDSWFETWAQTVIDRKFQQIVGETLG